MRKLLARSTFARWACCSAFMTALVFDVQAVAEMPNVPAAKPSFSGVRFFDVSSLLPRATKIHESILQASGLSNTTMVTTSEGNVVIDTSLAQVAGLHKKMLRHESAAPIRYIILTHAHKDHTGGIDVWREQGTEVIAHQNSVEFLNYQARLAPFFSRRNSAQFAVSLPPEESKGNFGAQIDATLLFEDEHKFNLGGVDFHLFHTPGETYDHVSVWIPQFKAAFVGDNYYRSFPNLYTPRGTKPRWALDYVDSLNKVISWEPEILISGHSPAILGKDRIAETLKRYRDAILHVHDETVKGMNEGKSVHQLMQEIKLPPDLEQDEKYGSVRWSVRGIYEGYAGWFDGNPANFYGQPASEIYPEMVAMAGGPTAVAHQAERLFKEGKVVQGLHMADMALSADQNNRAALQVRLVALQQLAKDSKNAIEMGWLLHGSRDASSRLKQLARNPPGTDTPQPAELTRVEDSTEFALGPPPVHD